MFRVQKVQSTCSVRMLRDEVRGAGKKPERDKFVGDGDKFRF